MLNSNNEIVSASENKTVLEEVVNLNLSFSIVELNYEGDIVNKKIENNTVVDITLSDDEEKEKRRQERELVFSKTIDKLNIIWYNSLNDTDKNNITNWRQAWLNYPNNLTLNRPEDLSIF